MLIEVFFLQLISSSYVWSKSGCDFPVLPNHVSLAGPIRTYIEGSKFYYKCEDGYKFVNSGSEVETYKVSCLDGKWNPSHFIRCVDECHNSCGAHGVCTKTIGREPYCQCDRNYYGKQCKQRVCDALPFMENTHIYGKFIKSSGFVINGKYSIDSKLVFVCNTGYETTDTTFYLCEITGWSRLTQPVCYKKRCSRPVPDLDQNLIYSPLRSRYSQGVTVQFLCPSHQQLDGVSSVLCNNNGDWSTAWPTCKSLKCPHPPKIQNAYYVSKDYYVNDQARYTCLPGLMMVTTNNFLTCNAQLQWVGQHPSCYRTIDFQKYCERANKVMVMSSPGHYVCAAKNYFVTTPKTYNNNRSQNTSTKPLTIVTSTAGGLLLLLLMVISLVACQRRRIARMHRRNGRRRINLDDDRYSFVYYSNDVHVVLPSYDEAIQSNRRLQPPPYISQDNRNAIAAPPTSNGNNAGNNSGEAILSNSDNEYETIDDILPQRNNNLNAPSQRRSSISSTQEEPVYASIQRVLSNISSAQNNNSSREESASIITLNSQAETASISTAHSHEDNLSTNNIYHSDDMNTSPVVSFADEALEDNDSISSAELCIGEDDDVPLINQK